MIAIASVQIGRVRTEGDPSSRDIRTRRWTTGFYKDPVPHSLQVTKHGIAGDGVADTKNHGGPEKAVLCYAASHYTRWAAEHPELAMSAGALGENLTLDGCDETSVCIGDRYLAGSCEFEVSQPRQPCWKIARRWGVKTLTKEVAQSGRTGWYLRVLREGQLRAGDGVELLARPNPEWSIARTNDILFGRESDRFATIELMALPQLSDQFKADIA